MTDTWPVTTAPESFKQWEERTRPSPTRLAWKAPGEIATVTFLAIYAAVNVDGFVSPLLLLVAFVVAERLITPIALSRGMSPGWALALRVLGTSGLVAYALLPTVGLFGIGLVAMLVAADWNAQPSLLRWLVSRVR
jgi:hypothetical protein